MDVRNCSQCGKIFRPVGGKRICPDCIKADMEEFQSVRDYLRKNPRANMIEVSDETGVSIKKLKEYVREGRLKLSSAADWGIQCENCGAPVTTGRLCPNCMEALQQELQRKPGAATIERKPKGEVMRTYRDKFRRR